MQARRLDRHKLPSLPASDDPVFWRDGSFSYASSASVQRPMKRGMEEGEEEEEKEEKEAARSRTAVWAKSFNTSWQLSFRSPCLNSRMMRMYPVRKRQRLLKLKMLLNFLDIDFRDINCFSRVSSRIMSITSKRDARKAIGK